MKKILFLLLLSFSAARQSNQKKIDSVRVLVEKAFNEKNPANLFQLTGEVFRKQLPETELKNVITQLHNQLGTWKSSVFVKSVDGVAFYKGIFEKATQDVYLALDASDKISTLLFRPNADNKPKKDYLVATDNKMQTALDVKVDSIVRPYIQLKHTTGLALAIVTDGKVYNYNYGETKRGNHQLPDPNKTLFEIGSISKTFTAILLADEVVKGKMALDDPINKYLPDSIPTLAFKGVPITLKSLSNHSSGLPRLPINLYKKGDPIDDPYKNYDTERMYTYLKHFKPFREVGLNYEYSNFAVGLLGNILAVQNHTTYEKLLAQKITGPLDMKHTFITIPAKQEGNFAQGYNEKGEATSPWDLNSLAGAGGIRSTINDMVIYTQANMNKAPANLQKAIDLTHAITFEQGQQIIGLGWHLTKNRNIYQHSGGTGGFRTLVAFDKTKKTAVVVLSNSAEEVAPIGFELLKLNK
ncbi:serine hydrolase [Emticicia sp. 21SJ11W-3]|uniref:serine hydrolase domain-containing protein n=1 Tax=Emticicia sp. 21SJ11W-3 TaxID=2916755 RepID=UPI0020A16F3A|nr:serine hydrolase [Emticicia sp. 21SJ11W-3]UTA68452.1 serine hydrolase [Emticicia sp. 21SJ11W-3]